MANLDKTRNDPLQQLWDEIGDIHAGMLGVEGSGQHMQPMAPQVEKESNSIWFYTKTTSDIVAAVRAGSRAMFTVTGKGHDYHVCMGGTIRELRSPDHIEKFWSSVVGAWFDGKDDPELTMLQLKLEDVAIWASTGSTLRFGWEVAKANLAGGEPDVGVHTHIKLPQS